MTAASVLRGTWREQGPSDPAFTNGAGSEGRKDLLQILYWHFSSCVKCRFVSFAVNSPHALRLSPVESRVSVYVHRQALYLLGKLALCPGRSQKAYSPISCLFGPKRKKEISAWQKGHKQPDSFFFNFMASGFCASWPFELQAGRNPLLTPPRPCRFYSYV